MASLSFHGLRLLYIVTGFFIASLFSHSLSLFPISHYSSTLPLLIHFPLSHSQLLQPLIRSLFHPTVTTSLQTKQAPNPIVSVPHACKDGPQQRQKGGV